jgi:Putative lumazine-binding
MMKTRLLAGTFALFWCAFPLPAQRTAVSTPRPTTVATVSSDEFRSFRWIVGRWRGVGYGPLASVGTFYEEYDTVDDSTMRMRTFADSAFTRPIDSTRFELRGGTLTARPARGNSQVVVRFAKDSVHWSGQGTVYVRVANDRWRAVFPPRSTEGDRPYYELRRVAVFESDSPKHQLQPAADREAVQRAALDYLEGFYEGDSTKHVRSIHPNVYKVGNSPALRITPPMTYDQFHQFSRNVRSSGRVQPPGTVKDVLIYDVLDRAASVKVTAYWGTDYLLMAKSDGRWLITHVLYQGPPTLSRQ